MSGRELPARPNLEQYKNQAKDLVADFNQGVLDALIRVRHHHPRFHRLPEAEFRKIKLSRTDAQLVIAREHSFESWPKFSKHIEMTHLIRTVGTLKDPAAAFIEVACVPRHSGHASGTLEQAEMLLSRYPHVAKHSIHTAAILADEAAVREFLARNPKDATAKGGPHEWDALTHLCFSRYLRIDHSRSEAFVRTARVLLEAGASAKTGWFEMIDYPEPRPTWESAIYGAAGIARHPELTRVLLEYGADPNDEETPYHVPESYDNTVTKILLESRRLNEASLACMLVRKADWHDEEGLRLVLETGANPNFMTIWGNSALHHALQRDNSLHMIELLLDHGADPRLKSTRSGRSGIEIAAHRGRGDVLALFEQRGFAFDSDDFTQLIAVCAKGDRGAVTSLQAQKPHLIQELLAIGGTVLAEFAGNGNVEGVRCLLDLGVSPAAPYEHGDAYFDTARNSTALHVAAWRARPAVVAELIARGAPVNALDAKGRSALALAVKACVDSYWTERRSPASVEALLNAGASAQGIAVPCGYDEVDKLLRQHIVGKSG